MSQELLERSVIRYRCDVYFGPDFARQGVEDFLARFRPSRVVIVTGRRSAKESGALDLVLDVLKSRNVEYVHFDKISPNPTLSQANELLSLVREVKPDCLIAIGGGSVIDTTKVVAGIYASEGVDVKPFFYGEAQIRSSVPVLAVNLTHGTGSEVDRFGVLTDEERCIKKAIGSDFIYPAMSIDDPKFTLTLPRDQTVYTTVDAFYHCLESSSTTRSNLLTRMLAERALKLIVEYLPRAYRDCQDLEARYWLLYASMLGGICLDNSRAHIVHAVEHAISGLKPEVPHGLGLAVIGPKLIAYMYSRVPEKFTVLTALIPDLKLRSHEHRRVEHFLKALVEQFGIKCSLSTVKLGKDDIPQIVKLTFEASSHLLDLAPYKITEEELKKVLEELA